MYKRQKSLLVDLFEREELDATIHLAGYKAVGDAVKSPLKYYRNNIASTTSLLEVMDNYGVRKIIPVSYTHLDVYKRQLISTQERV